MVTSSLILFYIAGVLTIVGAIGVVTTRNIVYAALALLVTLLVVAGVFLLAFAEFLALVQGLIYGILMAEDYALLLGALLLFAALAMVMLVTRNLDWYAFAVLGKAVAKAKAAQAEPNEP